ncbi:MAG: IS110 family transposase [Candidatus Sulfotelmatobacter sp.]
MQTLMEHGCGSDVHQATVVACVLIVRKDGKVKKQLRTFGTTTRELLNLREWLLSEGCTHVAMESTGDYWEPVYAILEGGLEIVVATAQHVKKVPGRETDVKDTEWIADLLCQGLLRSSFAPPHPIREPRHLTRYRRKLVESQSAERNRLLKLPGSANIKLASVASDVFGVSGVLMLQALVKGKTTSREMAELAKRKLRKKIPELELALEGKIEEHHRFLLELQLDRLRAVEEDLVKIEQRIQEKLEPYAAQLVSLQEIPGVDWTLAAVIIAELGVDMSVFRSVSQLAWAGACPGNNESAGKRKSSHIPKGNVYLKTDLVEAANAAAQAKSDYLRDNFYRLKAQRGYKRAAVAIAHKILTAIYHMLTQNVPYNDLGDLYLNRLNKNHLTRNLVHRLQRLGYSVRLTLQEKPA